MWKDKKKFLYSSSDSSSPEFVNPLFKKCVPKIWKRYISPAWSAGLPKNSPEAFELRDIIIPHRDIYENRTDEPRQLESTKFTGQEKRLSADYLSMHCSNRNLEGSMGYDATMIRKWIDETSQYAHIKKDERKLKSTESISPCYDDDISLFPDEIRETEFCNINAGKFESVKRDVFVSRWGIVRRTEDSIERQDYHHTEFPAMAVQCGKPFLPQSRKSRILNFCRGKRKINNSSASIPTSDSAQR